MVNFALPIYGVGSIIDSVNGGFAQLEYMGSQRG